MNINNISLFVFDFDGVLTNDLVYLNQIGEESVVCSRSDGLAFDVLRKLDKPAYILSTEKNPVVSMRAKKLKIEALQGVADKVIAIKTLTSKINCSLNNVLYLGNDINDYLAMQLCGYKICTADSHPKIKKISDICLKSNGGDGAVRELIEDVLKIDFIKILYK